MSGINLTPEEALRIISTDKIVAELADRGFKVYPARRIRTYDIVAAIDPKLKTMPAEQRPAFIKGIWERQAFALARGVLHAKALVQRTDEHKNTLMSRIMVVLPKTFDFEEEAKREHEKDVASLVGSQPPAPARDK